MRKYHRWFSIAAAIVLVAGITDTAIFVNSSVKGMFGSLIPIAAPGKTALSLNEGDLYRLQREDELYAFHREIPVDRLKPTTGGMSLAMRSKATGAYVSLRPITRPKILRWYSYGGWVIGKRPLAGWEFRVPHAGVYELDVQIISGEGLPSYLVGYNWEERWSQIYRLTAMGISGWLSVAALLGFLGYVKRPPLPVSPPQRSLAETEGFGSERTPLLHRFQFHGTGRELFGIFLVNLLFTVITLGIYSFWAKVKIRKYIWSQTEFAGDRLGFHGTGKELLFGWFKAAILFGGLVGFTSLLPMLWDHPWAVFIGKYLLFSAVLFLLVPIARIGAMRYRLSRTSWRGIRFRFGGGYPPFLGLSLRGLIFTVLTAGLYYPVYQTSVRRYLVDHSSFGSVSFKFDGDGGELTGRFVRAVLLTLPTLGLIWIWYGAQLRRFYWNHTSFAAARFRSTVTGKGLLSLHATNLLIIVLSLGIALPWATVRTKRYDLDHLTLEGIVDLDRITQQAQSATPVADELAGFLDVDALPG
jgi:uncharacterized membrane protein YjgN (DUF898 family)